MGYTIIVVPIWLAVVGYGTTLVVMLRCRSGASAPWARSIWTVSCVAYWVHMAAAFHFHHDWSHTVAYLDTQERAGWGEGIFITYGFTALWTFDVLRWWTAPASYERRPRWLHRAVHGFIAFIIFNGAVVFAEGFSRGLGISVFGCVVVAWFVQWRGARPAQSSSPTSMK